MAKIVFLQNLWFENQGTMSLSASLKANGHECEVFIGRNAREFVPFLEKTKPDLIAFSLITGMHRWALSTAAELKKTFPLPVIFGGPHPTFFPEIIDATTVDIVCRGEGEGAMVDLADAITAGRPFTNIANLWVKLADASVVRNDLRPLIQNLQSLPVPDRELYAGYPGLGDNPVLVVMASRGCPYNCTFCFNHQLAELYRGKGSYVRHRSPVAVVEEIKSVIQSRKVSRIYFADDTFSLDRRWLEEFLPRYGREIGIPFHCLVRINQIDEHIASLLRENGCETVFFGIESGDETIRTEILGKEISDPEIRQGAKILKRCGITFRTYNIIGFPGESLVQALKTVQLNIDIGTDFPWCSLFMPYPGTKLAAYAATHGFLEDDLTVDSMEPSFFHTSLLRNPEKVSLVNLQKLFQTVVLFPALLPIVKLLVRLPVNRLYQLWFSCIYFILYLRSEKRGLRQTIGAAIRNRAIFLGSKSENGL